MAKTLDMVFKTDEGKTVRISIPDPKEPVDPAQVNAVMDLLIAKNIFVTPLVEKVAARLMESNKTEIVLF